MKSNVVIILVISMLMACGTKKDEPLDTVQTAKPPVTVTHISIGNMYRIAEFNVYTQYLKRDIIRAPISGYIENIFTNPGEKISKGQVILSLQSPEVRAMAGTDLQNDTLLNFQGTIKVRGPKDGIINQMNYQEDAFVQQGDELMDIIGLKSIILVMNIPFENVNEISKGMKLKIILPGGEAVGAVVGNPLPLTGNRNSSFNNGVSTQVQSFILEPDSVFFMPENINMIAKVKIDRKDSVQRLARDAILTNETQTSFWVMKLTGDSTAVKTEIKKGIEEGGMVQIVEPAFSDKDRILLKGQYGLPDTAYVKVGNE